MDVDYSWWGWVDVSHDMMPRVTQPDPAQQVYYAFGYGGNGVSFSAHAGRRLAQRLMGQDGLKWDLPIYDSPLPGHLFAPFRRLGRACCTAGTTCATRCCEDGGRRAGPSAARMR